MKVRGREGKEEKNKFYIFYNLQLTLLANSAIIHRCVGLCPPADFSVFPGVQDMLEELKTSGKVVGIKQLKKALKTDRIRVAFLARNADPALTEEAAALCAEKQIPVRWIDTMAELGTACGIAVGASAAGLLR